MCAASLVNGGRGGSRRGGGRGGRGGGGGWWGRDHDPSDSCDGCYEVSNDVHLKIFSFSCPRM